LSQAGNLENRKPEVPVATFRKGIEKSKEKGRSVQFVLALSPSPRAGEQADPRTQLSQKT